MSQAHIVRGVGFLAPLARLAMEDKEARVCLVQQGDDLVEIIVHSKQIKGSFLVRDSELSAIPSSAYHLSLFHPAHGSATLESRMGLENFADIACIVHKRFKNINERALELISASPELSPTLSATKYLNEMLHNQRFTCCGPEVFFLRNGFEWDFFIPKGKFYPLLAKMKVPSSETRILRGSFIFEEAE